MTEKKFRAHGINIRPGGNGVAVLPDNGFAVTSFINRGLGGFRGPEGANARGKLSRGETTGALWEWSPAKGWEKVPGSAFPGSRVARFPLP